MEVVIRKTLNLNPTSQAGQLGQYHPGALTRRSAGVPPAVTTGAQEQAGAFWRAGRPRSGAFPLACRVGHVYSARVNNRLSFEQELRRERAKFISRRWFFQQCGVGLGSIALGPLLGANRAAAAQSSILNSLAPKQPHFKPKAKRVIYLFMGGAPSQLDLFDYKPSLKKFNGQSVPPEILKGQKYAFIKPDAALYASEFKFAKHGTSGAEISEALPHLAEVVACSTTLPNGSIETTDVRRWSWLRCRLRHSRRRGLSSHG